MTAIPFHVGDCVLLYNAVSDKYDKLTLQRKLPTANHRVSFWDAITDKGEPITVGEHEIEHAPREEETLFASIILGLGIIGVIVLCAFATGSIQI